MDSSRKRRILEIVNKFSLIFMKFFHKHYLQRKLEIFYKYKFYIYVILYTYIIFYTHRSLGYKVFNKFVYNK